MSTVESPHVLMLGWHAAAYAALIDHHARVLAVIDTKHLGRARGHDPSGTFMVVPDTGDVEQVLAGLARARIPLDGFDTVCTITEYPMVAAALLAQHCKAAGMPVATAIALRDKFVQKRLIRDAGLPVADARVVNFLSELVDDQTAYPVVVKPINGAASRDTHLVPHREALEQLAADEDRPPRGPWLVEEFIRGEELHIDGVVRYGTIQMFAVSRYIQNLIDIKSGGLVGSVVIAPDESPDLYRRSEDLLSAALQALGHTDGIFHTEVFVTDNGLVFSECGGRLGGGMIRETVLRHSGVHLSDEWARAALALPPGRPLEPSAAHCGFVQLPVPVGVARHVPDQTEILAQPGCLEAVLKLTAGSPTPDLSVSVNTWAGRAVVGGASEEQVRARLLALATWFSDSVVVQ